MYPKRLRAGYALATVLIFAGCAASKPQPGPIPLNVDVAVAHRGNLSTHVTLDGQVAPLLQSTLSFQQSGPIVAVYVNEGNRVRRGEVLARIDASTLRAQYATQLALAAQARAQAKGSQISLPVTQQANAAAVQTAKAALENAKLVFHQDAALFKQGYLSQTTLAAARSTFVKAGNDYDDALAGLQNTAASAQGVQASLASARAAAAQAAVLRTEIGQTVLYAPFSGIVTARFLDPGAMAGPATPILSVSRLATVWINLNVPDGDLAYVHRGNRVSFQSSSVPGRVFHGRVDTVNAVPSAGTLSYRARLRVPNPDMTLRGGMLVTVRVTKERRNDVVIVPRTAIAQTAKGAVVYVVQQKKAVAVPVSVGLETETLAQVISPKVRSGTPVIVTRPDALRNGSIVTIAGGHRAP
ncbi:MAG: efflux RND transporter periplasmic adaptor subunit [Vulcanimicrobiaceae bacterium]